KVDGQRTVVEQAIDPPKRGCTCRHSDAQCPQRWANGARISPWMGEKLLFNLHPRMSCSAYWGERISSDDHASVCRGACVQRSVLTWTRRTRLIGLS
ncbi:hypothetical protein A2U01_0014460, partial [Trifolium medium]|nr:hypothetical protein [Trifolium medium]